MGKIKELFTGEQRCFFIFATVVTVVALLLLTFAPGNNLIHWVGAKVTIANQQRQIREYREGIDRMDNRIKMLTSDRDTLEKFAREHFHFAAPGDDVYLLP